MKILKFTPIQHTTKGLSPIPRKIIKFDQLFNPLPLMNPIPQARIADPLSVEKVKNWNVSELKDFFCGIVYPDEIQLDKCTRIVNVPLFLESHLDSIDRHNGNEIYEPHLLRIQKLHDLLKTSDN
ncbi:MAG: hypothetical protein ISR55_10530 [Bacteroidetes bacterium]|nr:hypothetical protein [Bacteroidota bacterium]MBL6964250.1 hypothetical protein [Bacteroidota bacterium]